MIVTSLMLVCALRTDTTGLSNISLILVCLEHSPTRYDAFYSHLDSLAGVHLYRIRDPDYLPSEAT